MIKTYCDTCGDEINDVNTFQEVTVTVNGQAGSGVCCTVHISQQGTTAGGHFCKFCILNAIKKKIDDKEKIVIKYE